MPLRPPCVEARRSTESIIMVVIVVFVLIMIAAAVNITFTLASGDAE